MEELMHKSISIEKIMNHFKLQLIEGRKGLKRETNYTDLHRPGLQLAGFFTKFPNEKIQIIGNQESFYLQSLTQKQRENSLNIYFEYNPICLVVTNNHDTSYFKDLCKNTGTPLFCTHEDSQEFSEKLTNFLEKELAREIGVHGVCMNVFGVGILIRGDSGVGKSEAALSLINKGHRLISDDLVILKKIGPTALIATHNGTNRHFLALRGIGLVNVPKVFGSGSFQDETKVNLVVELSLWDDSKYYDAAQTEINYSNYLDTHVKHIEIPVRPGRDIAELIEVAAKNWRLEQEGYFAFEDFQGKYLT